MAGARTVNPGHLAAERPGATLVASTYRRLQRFFQYVQPGRDLGRDWAAPIAAKLAGLTGSWYLALDRTQWRIGAREVNFLVLAAVTRRFRAPLSWTLLPGRGNSSSQQRIALMRRYIKLFGVSSIRLLLADREFKACPRAGAGPRLDRFSLQKQHPLRHSLAQRPAHHHRGGP